MRRIRPNPRGHFLTIGRLARCGKDASHASLGLVMGKCWLWVSWPGLGVHVIPNMMRSTLWQP
jgi:hypothetical protein